MALPPPRPILQGRKALVVGVANDSSIAYGCAQAFREVGADLAITYLNEKARPHVEPLAEALEAPIFMPLDVSVPGQLEAVFERIGKEWGSLDILVHSIAFAPKEDLQGGLLNCSADGFAKAMDVSCHSFVRMAKLAAPLMSDGGTMPPAPPSPAPSRCTSGPPCSRRGSSSRTSTHPRSSAGRRVSPCARTSGTTRPSPWRSRRPSS
jgi:enoyl-[acyl-carrier protein] reductase I